MSRDDQWIRYPTQHGWRAFFVYSALLTALWIVVYGGACWLTSMHPYRVRLHLDAELEMPFVAEAAIVYLSLFPMIWLSPFVLQSPERLRKFAQALAWLFVLSGVGFLLLPTEEVRPPATGSGLASRFFELADWINLRYNNLPCLHVGMAVLCACAYSYRAAAPVTGFLWLWASAISVSTLVTHQHYVADVIAGALLGGLVARRMGFTSLRPE